MNKTNISELSEHPLWDTMNNLGFIKEYLKENLIEGLPNSFWQLLDKSIADVEKVVLKGFIEQ